MVTQVPQIYDFFVRRMVSFEELKRDAMRHSFIDEEMPLYKT